jgi:phospholipid transport system substrate-binding protein
MRHRASTIIFCTFVMLGLTLPAAYGAAKPSPKQVVRQTSNKLLNAIQSKRSQYKTHPQVVYNVVNKVLLPRFDLQYASRLVLGRYWRTASPSQRKRFEKAFYRYLLHSYTDGLVKYSNAKVEVQGSRKQGPSIVMVQTVAKPANHPSVNITYGMHRTKHGWKAFDVVIAGISYVINYRSQFASEIEQSSLNALIKHLRQQTQTKGPTSSSNRQ